MYGFCRSGLSPPPWIGRWASVLNGLVAKLSSIAKKPATVISTAMTIGISSRWRLRFSHVTNAEYIVRIQANSSSEPASLAHSPPTLYSQLKVELL